MYLESIGVSADCLEAIYNLGIVNVQLNRFQEAMLAFDKLHSITHHNCEVRGAMEASMEKYAHREYFHWRFCTTHGIY